MLGDRIKSRAKVKARVRVIFRARTWAEVRVKLQEFR